MFSFREFDYYYIVLVRGKDDEVLFVNSERHWQDKDGQIHITRVDLASTPFMMHSIRVGVACARKIGGELRRVTIGDPIDIDALAEGGANDGMVDL